MSDGVSRETIIGYIDYLKITGLGKTKTLDYLRKYVMSLPADRPQGKWFKDDEGTFICSACGSGYKDQPTLMGKPLFEWCPLCGARMKGADDE